MRWKIFSLSPSRHGEDENCSRRIRTIFGIFGGNGIDFKVFGEFNGSRKRNIRRSNDSNFRIINRARSISRHNH